MGRQRRRTGSYVAIALALSGLAIGGQGSAPAHAATTVIGVTLTTSNLSDALTPQPGIALGPVSSGSVNLTVDATRSYQSIDGFGAAFTDTADYLLYDSLSSSTRAQVMNDLFSPTSGIGLSLMRVPMGSSDFTATPTSNPSTYSYDDNGGVADPTLANFSIAHDQAYTIPVIKQAAALNPSMKLVATEWSPPAWMKTTGSMLGANNATLVTGDEPVLAQYFTKFLQAYKAQGVNIWAVTPQNEPSLAPPTYSGMLLPASREASFIANDLAPDITAAGLGTEIIGGDDVSTTTAYADTLLGNSSVYSDTTGTAWHCYNNDLGNMTTIHTSYPGKKLYGTECSTGATGIAPMNAAQLVLESTYNWASGAMLWNLALNPSGGPKMGQGCNGCTGLVTINQSTGAATFTDNYDQLGQFSKFVTPGAVLIGSSDGSHSGSGIWSQAYRDSDGTEVSVAYNTNSSPTTFTMTWDGAGSFSYTLPAGATVTFTKSATNGASEIVGQGSGRCLDDTGNAANGVQQVLQDCVSGSADQTYQYAPGGQLEIGGLCLGANGNGTANGTTVITWSCNGTSSQQWTFHANGSITNNLNGLCLDATGQGTANGTKVQLWTCTGNSNQTWTDTPGT
jgi:glucosylceramidase